MKPITQRGPKPQTLKGRLADKLAGIVGVIAGGLAIFGSLVFFIGFAANDSYFEALISALLFTAMLGAFAIAPPLIIARIGFKAYRHGGTRKGALLALTLSAPWTVLSCLLIAFTPLPLWISGLALILSLLLMLWALISLFADP